MSRKAAKRVRHRPSGSLAGVTSPTHLIHFSRPALAGQLTHFGRFGRNRRELLLRVCTSRLQPDIATHPEARRGTTHSTGQRMITRVSVRDGLH